MKGSLKQPQYFSLHCSGYFFDEQFDGYVTLAALLY